MDQDIEDIMNEAEGVAVSEEGSNLEVPADDPMFDEADVAEKMARSAQTVIETSAWTFAVVKNILIVCDPTTTDVDRRSTTQQVCPIAPCWWSPKGRHHGEEPPAPVANLMRQQQVVIAPTRYSLTHTRAVHDRRSRTVLVS